MRWFILLCLTWLSPPLLADPRGALDQGVEELRDRSFEVKASGIQRIASSGHPMAATLLARLLAGDLHWRRSDGRLTIATAVDREFILTDAIDGIDLGSASRREVEKITINNSLRRQIRIAIATLELSDANPETRLAAVRQLFDRPDSDAIASVRLLLPQEQDERVADAMVTIVALEDLKSDDPARVVAAIEQLSGSLLPAARNGLRQIADQHDDAAMQKQASKALGEIEFRLQLNSLAETLFFGLSLGSILVLAAIGLAITFGVMGVINMAHGELIMIGAYTTWMVQQLMPNHIDYSLWVAIPAAFIVAGLVGIAIERGVIRFLYGRPLETLLATFGISLLLQQLVRTTISAQNVAVANPSWMSGALEINPVLALTWNRIYIILFALLVFFILLMVLKRTALGLQVRAVAQNRAMARAMGVRSGWVDAMTFGLGSGIAGVAGVALSQLTNVGPNLGQAYIIDSFMVVVFGGVGNLWGTLVAGMSLGVINKILEPWAGAVLAKILVLIFIILFIQKRPRGLFPQKGRAAEG
jgi:urea transport system permease protein